MCQNRANFNRDCSMYWASCSGVGLGGGADVGSFDCTVDSGQFGSPVWTFEPSSRQRFLRGIVISVQGGQSGGSLPASAGPGVIKLVTQDIYFELMDAISTGN